MPAASSAARTRSALCAARLSITTTASGRCRKAGMSTCSTKARKPRVPVAAALLIAAATPSRARAPSTVSRFQWPQGTVPAARRPLGARPEARVIRVSTPHSSRNTRRRGSIPASSARHSALARARSALSCSAARSAFFAREAELPERTAHGRAARLHPGALAERGRVLGQGAVVGLGRQLLQPVERCLVQAWRGPAGVRPRLPSALGPPSLLPPVEGALPDPEQRRDPRPAQPAALARPQHPVAQLRRVRPCHGPPSSRTPRRNGSGGRRLPTGPKSALDRNCLACLRVIYRVPLKRPEIESAGRR